MYIRRLFHALTLYMCGVLMGQGVPAVLNTAESPTVLPSIEYLVDTSGTLTFTDMRSTPSTAFSQCAGTLNLGLLDKPVWVRMRIKNADPIHRKYVCYIEYPLLDTVIMYQTHADSHVRILELGESYPSYTRFYDTKNIVFPLKIAQGEEQEIIFEIKTSGAVYFPVMVTTEQYLFDHEKYKYLYYGLFYGAILVVVCYNFFLYVTLKDTIYLLYNMYLLSIVASTSTYSGFISYLPLFDDNRTLLNKLFGHLVIVTNIANCLFCYRFLEIYKKKDSTYYMLRLCMGFGVLFLVMSLFMPYAVTGGIATFLFILTPMLIFFISLRKWHEGNKIARFYIFATTFFLVSVVITCLKVLGLIESTMAQEFMLEIGVAIDAVFISLALGDKLRNLNYEKNMAKEKERVAIADKERLITEQNSVLENKISNRMDEIIQKSYQLEFFSKKIKDQNNLLKKHNENLELQIEERTKQVVLTNTQLKRKTARLEQFTYIVSHNLKSPVRNISTLMDFVQEEKLDMTTKAYFDILKKTNNQLKNIIEDINILVSHDQHTEIELSSVNLPTVVGNIQDKLLIQIIESNCVIDTDFAVSTFMSFPPYITSILYNLINNAIKHRSWDRPIKIHITSYKIEDAIVITVVDNGKGIAAEQLPHVCKLFYKVDNDQEGKGMGLFIVKSQIEQLGGKLHIGSVLNEGTIFEISIPQK